MVSNTGSDLDSALGDSIGWFRPSIIPNELCWSAYKAAVRDSCDLTKPVTVAFAEIQIKSPTVTLKYKFRFYEFIYAVVFGKDSNY